MPCESCNIQFTVFRRKRTCTDCKRFYCSNCLSTARRNTNVVLCERCAIFAKRPLLRADLLQLKPKDLIFYLQSKHISTTGCVEKDELIGLVLNHVQLAEAESTSARNASNNTNNGFQFEADSTNSFDTLKQSCQNFFSNITDNITESFSAFDGKSSSKANQYQSGSSPTSATTTTTSNGPTHIFDQPRVSTREIPTYASCQTRSSIHHQTPFRASTINNDQTEASSSMHCHQTATDRPASSSSSAAKTQSQSSQTASPVVSINSPILSHPPHSDARAREHSMRNLRTLTRTTDNSRQEVTISDCDCSDDEVYQTFYGQATARSASHAHERLSNDNVNPCRSTSSACKLESRSSKMDMAEDVESSQSSFEELGAIGGISDDSKAATDTNSSNIEQWQFLDAQRLGANGITEEESNNDDERNNVDEEMTAENPQRSTDQSDDHRLQQPVAPQRTKKVLRRRSDSYLKRQRPFSDDESPTATNRQFPQISELSRVAGTPTSNCSRCGKHKINIKRRVDKMRRYLENSQMPEEDIKTELIEFLTYLERRTKSLDCSDSETIASPLSSTTRVQTEQDAGVTQQPDDDDDGIHVYAGSSEDIGRESRFINLDDYKTMEELDSLSVKQLKEVLMLNRVDYKGCCEKQELLDRVQRLWKNLQSMPGVDKLQTDELCKICMDAPIECVILECGHMATCTNCGKVLSECPICRQYIVRVVRFFRA